MSTSSTIRFAVIGTGMIARFHAQAVQASEGAKLVAAYGRNAKTAKEFGESFGIKTHASLEALLADPEIDAVTIATPTGDHGSVAIPAAKAGKHMLCEKPLDVTAEKADAIIRAAADHKVLLAPIFQSRYAENSVRIKKALVAGRFGKLLMASASIKWFRPQSYYDSSAWRGTYALDGGGCLMNQGIHFIDLLLHFAGDVAEVYGHAATMTHKMEAEDVAAAVLKFKSGAIGVIEGSTSTAPGFPAKVELCGERGSAILEADKITRWEFTDQDPMDEEIKKSMTGGNFGSGASDPKGISIEGHKKQIEELVRAIREKKPIATTGEEARRPIALINAIYASSQSGKPIRL